MVVQVLQVQRAIARRTQPPLQFPTINTSQAFPVFSSLLQQAQQLPSQPFPILPQASVLIPLVWVVIVIALVEV